MNPKLIAIFIVFLLVNVSFSYADLSDPIQAVEKGLEKTGEALSTFEATDFIINVDSYQPTVLSEQAFESDQPGGYPIFATLRGMKTNPLMDLQKLHIPSIRATGGSTKYVRSVYYRPPKSGYFDLNNLGYIVVRLKNLKEDEVPKRLDINLTANILFEIQNGFGINEQDKTLPVLSEEEFLNEKTKHSFWGGRGYIRLANIRGDTADFIVYDGMGNKNSISVKEGKESLNQYLTGGRTSYFFNEEDFIGRNLRDSYRIKVNQITGNKDEAEVEMLFNGEFKSKKFVEGQYLYPGSKWKVRIVKKGATEDIVEFIKEGTNKKLILKAGEFYIPYKEEVEEGVVEVEEVGEISDWIEKYSKEYNVDPSLVKGLIHAESGWRMQWNYLAQDVLNKYLPDWKEKNELVDLLVQERIIFNNPHPNTGKIHTAYGYGQITRTTAKELSKDIWERENTDRRFDPESNIRMTIYYLSKLGIKSDVNNVNNLLFKYTGNSGGVEHVNRIIEYANKYEDKTLKISEKKVRIGCCNTGRITGGLLATPECSTNYNECGDSKWIEGGTCDHISGCIAPKTSEIIGPQPEESEEKEKRLSDTYKTIEKEIDIFSINKASSLDGIKPTLDKYRGIFNEIKDDPDLFARYYGRMIHDLSNLHGIYFKGVGEDNLISDGIKVYLDEIVNYKGTQDLEEKKNGDTALKELSSTDNYFLEAIKNYRIVADDFSGAVYDNGKSIAMDAQEKIATIYDLYLEDNEENRESAIQEYQKLISSTDYDYPYKEAVMNRIEVLQIGKNYRSDTLNIFENDNSISLTLRGIEKADEESKVVINVNGKSKEYLLKKNRDILEGTNTDTWYLKEINNENVVIVRYEVDKDTGKTKEIDPKTLRLNNKNDGRIRVGDKTDEIIVENIILNQKVHITILPGEEKITTQTSFKLHIPVEPRLWKLSTEQMNDHINASRKLIDLTNKAINAIESLYKVWSLSCYGTFAVLYMKNVWFGGAKNVARRQVMNAWSEKCEAEKGDVFKCIEKNKELINSDINKVSGVYREVSNLKEEVRYGERVKRLATQDFVDDNLEKKYKKEAFNFLINEEVEKKIVELKKNKKYSSKSDSEIREEAIIRVHESILNGNQQLKINWKNTYKFNEEDFDSLKLSEFEKDSGLDKFSKNDIYEVDGKSYLVLGNKRYQIYKDKDKYYKNYDTKTRIYTNQIETFEGEVEKKIPGQTEITLENSGKWKGRVDKLSVDSVYYLDVAQRGGEGEIIKVELRHRSSEFGEILPLDTRKSGREFEPFNIDDCIKGSSSDRSGVDTLAGLKLRHPRLQQSCKDLMDLDRKSGAKAKDAKSLTVAGRNYAIQSAMQETGGLECFDIMGIDDCLTLFSVCDPVMCPVSRFNAGGAWSVDNVVSTGIFGSTFLGIKLWDFTRVPPEVGICIPGVNAGLKNYRSLFEGYEQCMIKRRDEGENVGICDTIRSVGFCKIAWREGTSFLKLSGNLLDTALNFVTGKTKGGGEYAYFQTNMQRTGEFLSFFTKEYATTYFSAYRGASTDEIGDELCKVAIYGKVPGVGGFLDQLTKPEGPVQFTGWFTEAPHSDLMGELTSDYEVYYHIYAGEDRDQVRYVVYLKDVDDLSRRPLYITRSTGYLNKGDFVDETVRRIDLTGYDELCIVIDNKENCGFGRVSSELLLDVIEDSALEKSAKRDIKSEEECKGDTNIASNPGIGSLVDAMYPNIARSGLIRVCSRENPDKGISNETWIDVGTCGINNLGQDLGRCWLSRQSYKDALSEYDIKRRQEADEFFKKLSGFDLKSDEEMNIQITSLINTRNFAKTLKEDAAKIQFLHVIKEFEGLISNTMSVDLTGEIYFEIGETYFELAKYLGAEPSKPVVDMPEPELDIVEDVDIEGKSKNGFDCEFEYADGTPNPNVRFKYLNKWNFASISTFGKYKLIEENGLWRFFFVYDDIVRDLLGVKSYIDGVKLLLSYVNKNKDTLIVHKDGNKFEFESNDNTAFGQVNELCNLGAGEVSEELISKVTFSSNEINEDTEKVAINFFLNKNVIGEVGNVNQIFDPKYLTDINLRVYDLSNNLIYSSSNPSWVYPSYYFFIYDKDNQNNLDWKSGVYIYKFNAKKENKEIIEQGKFSLIVNLEQKLSIPSQCGKCGKKSINPFDLCDKEECEDLGDCVFVEAKNILDTNKCVDVESLKPEIPIEYPKLDIAEDYVLDDVTGLSLGEFEDILLRLEQIKQQLPPPPREVIEIDTTITTRDYSSLYTALSLTENIYNNLATAEPDKLFVNNKQTIERIRQILNDAPTPMPPITPDDQPVEVESESGISIDDYKNLYEEIEGFISAVPPPEPELATCENKYPGYECVDVNKYNCEDIHIGLCPGGNNIRCCINKIKKKEIIPPALLNEDFLLSKDKNFCNQYTCKNYEDDCLWWDCKSEECTISFNVDKILIDYRDREIGVYLAEIIACGKNNKRISPLAYSPEDSIPSGTVMEIKNWIGGYKSDCSTKTGATSLKYSSTQIHWGTNGDYDNPYGPAYANLVTAKRQKISINGEEKWYNEGITLHRQLHGTNGPITDKYYDQGNLGLFTHGCLRSSNRFIMWLRDHAKPGTLVYYIDSGEGDSVECSDYSDIV